MSAPKNNQNARKYTGVLSSVSFRIPQSQKASWVKQAQVSKHKKLTAWLINRINGIQIHTFDELPSEPTGALIIDISGKEPTIICVTDYTTYGWDRKPKANEHWIAEDDFFNFIL